MMVTDLIERLRHMSVETGSLVCLGCGHEHNCNVHGCAVLKEAADALEWQFRSVKTVELTGGEVYEVEV